VQPLSKIHRYYSNGKFQRSIYQRKIGTNRDAKNEKPKEMKRKFLSLQNFVLKIKKWKRKL